MRVKLKWINKIHFKSFALTIEKRFIKTPKLYFMDTGLAAYLPGTGSPGQASRDKMRGNLFENFVIIETTIKR